mgnify:CR=1 FL=1
MCYEDIVLQYARDSVVAGAEVLVSLINGSAFENPLALEQHFQLALLRALENRRPLIRCAGTGVSAIVDPIGRYGSACPRRPKESWRPRRRLSKGGLCTKE